MSDPGVAVRIVGLMLLLLSTGAAALHADALALPTSSLSGWRELIFPFNPRHTDYSTVVADGAPAIRIVSDNAASALVYRRVFDTYRTPVIQWGWKAMNVLAAGNAETKEGDDYGVRIEVMFPFDESELSFVDRARLEAAKAVVGFTPPADVLNYVWANRPHAHNPIPNAYSERGMMFFADAGAEHVGEWRVHSVNIIDDFRKAFRRDPPPRFTIAVMGDTDNTHGRTVAFIRDITVSSE